MVKQKTIHKRTVKELDDEVNALFAQHSDKRVTKSSIIIVPGYVIPGRGLVEEKVIKPAFIQTVTIQDQL